MSKMLKIIITIVSIVVLFIVIDLLFIFTLNKPLFAIKDNDYTYKGILYNTYQCPEFSIPQIKSKFTKYSCAIERKDIGKVISINDETKNIKDFSCAEALVQFYKDNQYTYFYPCMKSKYIIVKYDSGYEETVENALKYGTIQITDLDKYNIEYLKYNN